MARLKSRQKFIPNGFKFYQPETKWKAPANASFETIVNALISHRRGQPFLAKKHNWKLDKEAVANEVDEFNALVCMQMGWLDYVQAEIGVAPPPKFPAPSAADQSKLAAVAGRVKKIWAGVRTLDDWLDSNEPPVKLEQAERRAKECSSCNKNTPGDFTAWFTAPAAESIKRQVEKASSRNLKTSYDGLINVCSICLCPLKLKVHTPMKFINAHLSESILRDLEKVPNCWIIAERRE